MRRCRASEMQSQRCRDSALLKSSPVSSDASPILDHANDMILVAETQRMAYLYDADGPRARWVSRRHLRSIARARSAARACVEGGKGSHYRAASSGRVATDTSRRRYAPSRCRQGIPDRRKSRGAPAALLEKISWLKLELRCPKFLRRFPPRVLAALANGRKAGAQRLLGTIGRLAASLWS